MAMVLLLVAGVFSYNQLRQELFPEISFSIVYVVTTYQQGDPSTVANDVTSKVEDLIIGMSDLEKTTSISTGNLSLVTANFIPGADVDDAEEEIRSRVNGLTLPDNASDPFVLRLSSDIFPVMLLTVSGNQDIPSLRRITDDEIIPRLEAVNGVYEVRVEGGVPERVSVIVDPARTNEHNLTIQDVVNAVSGNAIDLNAGTLNNDERSIGLRAYQGYGNLDSIRDLPVGYTRESANPATPGSTVTPVLLSDVATVTIDTPESETVSRTNGQPSLSLEVLRLPEGNTIELAQELLAVIDDLDLPPGVRVDVLYNDGPALEEQLANVVGQGGLGFIIAVSAIFLFLLQIRPTVIRGILNTLRPTLITAISIPLSVMITVLVMAVFDWSLNFMSLAGLAIAVGRIVDDSIVVLENIYRHIQVGSQRLPTSGTETVAYRLAPLGDNPRLAAAIRGTREVGPAILASTLTTVAVFLPLGFIPGIVGEFFLPFAQTVCVSLLASTLIALTVVPVLASMLLRQGDMADEDDTVVEDTWLQKIYTPILRWALNHPLLTVLGCIAAVAASLPLLIILPITLFSSGEAESMRIDVTMPENTGPAAMFREVRSVEQVLDGYVNAGYITAYQGTMGSTSQDFGPGIGESGFDVAGFFLALSDDVPQGFADELREALPDKENVDIQVFVDEAGPPQSGIEIAVTGSNFNRVQSAAATLLERIAPLDGVVNLKTNVSDSKEEVTFEVDTKEAGRYGLNSMAVAGQIRTWAYGHDAADLNLSGDTYDVVVRGKSDQVDEIVELQALPIAGAFGAVPLGSISDVKTTVGPSVVTHYDGDRSVTITGEIESRDPQAVSARINGLIADAGLPPGVTIRQGGFASDIEEQFQNVYIAMAIGLALVYLVMVATLGSLRDPFIVVLSMPLAVVGALIALTLTGRALSLPSMMGFLFLIGIVVTNAIVLIIFVEQLRSQGLSVLDAIMLAGRTRLRPILMTAFTTILALFPLAFSQASGLVGSELATVVIGGLISSTFLTLVAVPVTYLLLHQSVPDLAARVRRMVARQPRPEADAVS
jgi:HAE1 family hydrophobic/amphiphilic exporter-1